MDSGLDPELPQTRFYKPQFSALWLQVDKECFLFSGKVRMVLDAGLWSQQFVSRVAGLAEPCPTLKVPQEKYLGEELHQALRSR